MKTFNEWVIQENKTKNFNELATEESEDWQSKIISALPKNSHYVIKCSCGNILSQCRCGSNKIQIIVPNSCDKCS